MSLRDMLTSHLFKQDDSGRTIVFPYGVLGRGYVLDPRNEVRIRRSLGTLTMVAILLGVAGSQVVLLLFGNPSEWPYQVWGALGAALLSYGVGYRLIVAHLVQDLAVSPARLGLFEAVEKQAQAMPRWYLWVMFCTALMLCAGAAIATVAAGTMAERVMGMGGLVLFAIVLAQSVYGLKRHARVLDRPD
jgi:hypothetical protein